MADFGVADSGRDQDSSARFLVQIKCNTRHACKTQTHQRKNTSKTKGDFK